ncbi:MAG: hypothetical protein FI687_04230 [SAR202 cluster bacterium]|nr:hypothetical protein [SAR202 cluster bacterium]|tara:strand:+ start:297 stop:770 length:474 start_codon:yes stop_codon:yes gene_type:complete
MPNELNTENSIVTIIIEMTYKEDVQIIKKIIKEESGTFTVSKVNRFEFFLNEDQQKATIIETFEDGDIFDEIAEKLLEISVNPKLLDIFEIKQIVVLGKVSSDFKEKIRSLGADFRDTVGGFSTDTKIPVVPDPGLIYGVHTYGDIYKYSSLIRDSS